MEEQEHPKLHVMAKSQQPHSDVPLFLLFYICHQAFWRGLLWEPCWREICLCTLTHTWHAHTVHVYISHTDAWDTHTHSKRDKCEGSVTEPWYDHEVCQSRVVVWHLSLSVSLSAMGNTAAQESSSQRVTWWGRMCFQWWGLTMHVDMLRDLWRKFSAPLGLSVSWVSRVVCPSCPHIHTNILQI